MTDGDLVLVTFTLVDVKEEDTAVVLRGSGLSAAAPNTTAIAVSAQDGVVNIQAQSVPIGGALVLVLLGGTLAFISVLILRRKMKGRAPCSILLFCVLFSLRAVAVPLACDLDTSGLVDGGDLELMVDAVLSNPLPYEYDVDYSGETDAVDYQLVVRAALGYSVDTDADGLTDAAEANLGTDPALVDTDTDGLADGIEVIEEGTDPLDADTDNDGVGDGQEIAYAEDPLLANFEYIVVNEFVASNQAGLQDEDSDYPDWIELHNPGSNAVNLNAWTLSDNAEELDKWAFPAVTLSSGAYLVVFASSKDRKPADGSELHTNFKLSASGEYLVLCDSAGTVQWHSAFSPDYPQQRSDISYGRYPLTPGFWFFDAPTPGAANEGGNKYRGFVDAVAFSIPHGFRETPFDLELSCETPGAAIRYTLDGSLPAETTGMAYSEALVIDASATITARAYHTDFMPSNASVRTYLFGASPAERSLPILSLVGDEEQTFYEPNGVMAIVGGHYEFGNWVPDGPGDYNNPMQRGRAYERPVSVEYIAPGGGGFQINGGLRVHGALRAGYTRCDDWTYPPCRFSFRLYFRTEYGKAELDYPLFPGSPAERIERLVIRNGPNLRAFPYVVDEFARQIFLEMGQVTSHGCFVNLFINGDYKGYSNLVERLDEPFFQSCFNSDEDWDIISAGREVRAGDDAAFDELINLAMTSDLSSMPAYQAVCDRLDVLSFIDYLILELYIRNSDWVNNNWCTARERSATGKFRMHLWDADCSMEPGPVSTQESLHGNGLYMFPSAAPGGGRGLTAEEGDLPALYRALRENTEFRQLFSSRVRSHFFNGGVLTEGSLLDRFEQIQDTMLGVMPEMDRFVSQMFIPGRREPVLRAFAEEGLFEPAPPHLDVAGNELRLSNPNGTGIIYYTLDGIDPRDAAQMTILASEAASKRVFVPMSSEPPPSAPFFDVTRLAANIEVTSALDMFDIVNGPTLVEGTAGERAAVINYFNTGIDGHFGANAPFPGTTLGENVDDFVVFATGRCFLPAGEVTLAVNSNDGFMLWVDGRLVLMHADMREAADSSVVLEVIEPDVYDIRLAFFEHDGGSELEFFAAQGNHAEFNPVDFHLVGDVAAGGLTVVADWTDVDYDHSTWIAGSGGVGYETATALYSGLIGLDIEAQMYGQNGGCYVRIPFTIPAPDLDELRFLTLKARYNDGFAAYINGQEVMRVNAPAALRWNSIATDTHGGSAAANVARFAIPHGIPLLQTGDNVLSLHGLNVDASDADFLISAELVAAKETPPAPAAIEYTGALSLSGNTQVTARVFTDGLWSPIVQETFSPGTIPAPGAVVINEVLAHTHGGAPDWIELHNTTDAPINIEDWFLSDDEGDLMKYEIAAGISLPAHGYAVFYEDLNFGDTGDSGCSTPFALSENGDTVYLSSGDNGGLTGYYEQEDFGASENSIAFGRYLKSTGTYNFVAMSANTPGAANAYPKVGPIVINEIMYNPSTGDQDEEYIELYNLSGTPVQLYDGEANPWKFAKGIDFTFPPATSIPASGYLLVVKDIGEFNARYPGTPGSVQVLGPYDGKLSNGGEKLEVAMPGDLDGLGERQYIRIDRVNYDDDDPWPESPDGDGHALTRLITSDYGNDAANWTAAEPSPGE